MSTTPEFSEAQLLSARATAWHQAGEPLLTLEVAREWVNNYGLVLFAPHATTLGAPAPSLVEATLGATNTEPTAAQTEVALGLLARLVAEGSAVPLNLLGGPGDMPDFVASAQVFSFCYTLRGDKAWKQPPAQTGAIRVSPLSLRVFEVLSERGSLTAGGLVAELGREVTGSAVTRALGELWAQLRVLPRRDAEGTLWELSTQRFTKAIKAGSNAGLPKALSALVSLYLHQAIGASEAEIEAFLSPLTARSRIREVAHALTAARELETVVLDGKTMLYVADALPEFAPVEPVVAETSVALEATREAGGEDPPRRAAISQEANGGEGRISRFKGVGPRGGDLRGKPFRSAPGRKTSGGAFNRGDRARPAGEGRGGFDRPAPRRRPDDASRPPARAARPAAFSRPWEEERRDPAASPQVGQADRTARPFRPRTEGDSPRPSRPRSEGDAPRPFRPRTGATDRDASRGARPGADRGAASGEERRPARRPFGDAPRREFRAGPPAGTRPGAFRRGAEARDERPERDGAPARVPDRAPRPDRAARPDRPARSENGAGRTQDFGANRASRPERRPFSGAGAQRSSGAGAQRSSGAGAQRSGGEGAQRSSGPGAQRPSGAGERRPFVPRSQDREGRDNREARPKREARGGTAGTRSAPVRSGSTRPSLRSG